MRQILISAILFASSIASAEIVTYTTTCTFGEKEVVLEISNDQVTSAQWSNPDWGIYGAHQLNLSQVTYLVSEVIISHDIQTDANGRYVCHGLEN